jgi:hypothetical protein
MYSTMEADSHMLNVEKKMTSEYYETVHFRSVASVDVIMIHLASFRQPRWRSFLDVNRMAAIDQLYNLTAADNGKSIAN